MTQLHRERPFKITMYKDRVVFNHPTYAFEEVLRCYGNATLALLTQAKDKNPDKLDLIYSTADVMFSNILNKLDPDKERYPDFTVEAMEYAMRLLATKKLSELPEERKQEIENNLKQLVEDQRAKVE